MLYFSYQLLVGTNIVAKVTRRKESVDLLSQGSCWTGKPEKPENDRDYFCWPGIFLNF